MDTDRNLLFAVLALQADLLDRERFVQACTLWAGQKERPIAELLIEQGWLTPEDRADVERLLDRKLRKHGGDVQASLAEVAGAEVRGTLGAVADADVEHSLATLPPRTHSFRPPRTAAGSGPTPDSAGRNILYEVIGCGGMGRVLRGYDRDLGRDLAVKVLRDEFRGDATVQRRFVEEAQVGGQLQHPGLVPVHELGRFPDGLPYFTMKLVKGRTLADLLKQRPDPGHEQARFLTIFEQICQTVAFAHSRRVIHRDLKPANVMVGSFGEVQVMDWGLAKVLGQSADDPQATTAQTVVRTLRSGSTAPEDGRTGVVGTPAYMAPEQARGAVEAVDERADVFGLGAILCVILTGQPPYGGSAADVVMIQAALAELDNAFARLNNCEADADLIVLCKACLAARREDRPSDAAAVAARIAAYQATVQQRLRQVELERAAAEARAAEQRQRRRIVLAASGVITLVLLAGLSASLWQMRRAMQAEDEASTNAQQARDEAKAKGVALTAEHQAREDEARAQRQAFAALRSMTDEVVERKFAQGVVLTEDDRKFLRGIIAQFDAFADTKGDDADSRAARAEGRFRVGNMRHRLGELQEAEKDYDQALTIWKELAADFPSRPEFRHDLASSHSNRGVLLATTGRPKEAEKDYDQALSILKQLVADFPDEPDLRNSLAGNCVNLACLHLVQGKWIAAKRLLLEGRPHHLAALKVNPRHPAYREFYRNHLGVLTTVHAGLLDQADAVHTAETWRDLGWDAPADAYDAACLLSQCISIVAKRDKLNDKQRKEAAQFYGDQAMKLLRDAVSKGYKDVARMKKDTDLDPLRQREDFQELVAELEAKGN
jgi:serine/threonine protein kinase